MLDKLKGFAEKAKDFDYSGKLESLREKSLESYDSIKTRWIDDSVQDEAQFAEGFQTAQKDVVADMEAGSGHGPMHYLQRAEKGLKGDYKAGYIAGVDATYKDL